MGPVEPRGRPLRLLPHQRPGGPAAGSGASSVHPPGCDRPPVCRPAAAPLLRPAEETLTLLRLLQGLVLVLPAGPGAAGPASPGSGEEHRWVHEKKTTCWSGSV